jgi:hypothetical protein
MDAIHRVLVAIGTGVNKGEQRAIPPLISMAGSPRMLALVMK